MASVHSEIEIQTPAGDALLDLIESLSNENWCAAWLADCEYDLWLLSQLGEECSWGRYIVPIKTIERLRELSRKAEGWWRWDEEEGPVFVTFAQWRDHCEAKTASGWVSRLCHSDSRGAERPGGSIVDVVALSPEDTKGLLHWGPRSEKLG